eukprot:272730-Prymnesium_polylepis.1
MRAPELDAMCSRGMPLARAYLETLSKKTSSCTPKEPDCTVQSLATMTSGRPSGYSVVLSVVCQPTMPTLFSPTRRSPAASTPSSPSSSSSTSRRSAGIDENLPSAMAARPRDRSRRA